MAARWGAGTIVYRRARWPAGRRSGERGFTLVEVLIAITLMLGTLLGLAYISTNGLVDVGLARQRQGATGLANEAIEKMRTLPFDTLARGLDAADAAADPRIVACGTNLCSNGEIVPTFSAGATTVDPIVPHVTPGIVVGPTTYTVSAYVTRYADPDGTTRPNVYRGRVVASWANSLRGGIAPEVVVESVFHSPAGCQSTATHPFAAPCEPFFYASASSDAASIRIEPVAGGWGTLRDAALELTQHSSAMQVEQVHSVQGSARLPAVSMRYTDGSPDDLLIAGAGVAPTASSNDPTLGLPPYSASTLNLSSLGALVSNGPNSVAVNSAGGHASSVSTIAANGAQPCQGQTDDRPCGTAHGHQDGILSATVLLADGRVALAARVEAALLERSAGTDRRIAASGTCSGAGCVDALATRTIGRLTLGDLPDAIGPAGFVGLVVLEGFEDGTAASAGLGTLNPSGSVAGTLRFWNGAGYTTWDLSDPANQDRAIPASVSFLGTTVTSVNLRTGGLALTPATCTSPCTRGEAVSGSPLTGTIRYQAGGNEFLVHIDLGRLVSRATYTPAPTP